LTAARAAQNQTGLPVMNVFPRGQPARDRRPHNCSFVGI
jgi:hypothetical protein